MTKGPMRGAIIRLFEEANDRHNHFAETARIAGTPGRRQSAEGQATYYDRIAKALLVAVKAAEQAP
jgi:hypothetical protein